MSDSIPTDSVPGPGPDSVVPPPDSAGPVEPLPPVNHVGIPFGPYHLPQELYGPEFTGALRSEQPESLLIDLVAARRANVRVFVGLVGHERRYRDDNHHFSLEKWKARVDRFREIDFSSYIEDGTIIGHFIMDEPHDENNWGGTVVSPATIDEMAKYSKQIWPSMATIIRGWPAYLKGYDYQYLDAAWAQYHERFGSIATFIDSNVQDSKSSGLALVLGLNLLAGGGRDGLKGYDHLDRNSMSASQVTTWGNALLAEPYICAFIGWKYNAGYFSRSDIKAALSELSQKARSLPKRACRT